MISEAVHFSQPVPPEGSAIEIYRDGEVEPFYSVNLFLSEPDSGTPGVQILFICELEEKALVAVPQSAWHRTLSRRVLPPTALLKATLVEVACARKSALDQLLEGQTIKVWIGFLGPEFIDHVQTHLGFFEAAHYFDDDEEDPMLPYAPALIEVAQEHFAFFSANEEEAVEEQEEPPELIPDESGSVPIEHRLLRLEQSLANLAKGVETMLKEKTPKPKATSKAKAVPANPKAKSNATVRAPALRKTKKNSEVGGADVGASYPSLDPGVVAAALQAGVPKENLEEMEKLIGQNSKAAVVKDLNKVRLQDPLSEDEDATEMEMQKEDGVGSGAHADPVAQSLSKLTSIIQVLTDDRKKKDKSKLEEALDSVGASSTDSLGIGSGKKNAAARRALRATFEDHPEEIHRMIERLMYEDLQSQTLGPNQQPVGLNARSWVEFRSRIGNFKASAYAAWSAAGILDAMIAGNIPKAMSSKTDHRHHNGAPKPTSGPKNGPPAPKRTTGTKMEPQNRPPEPTPSPKRTTGTKTEPQKRTTCTTMELQNGPPAQKSNPKTPKSSPKMDHRHQNGAPKWGPRTDPGAKMEPQKEPQHQNGAPKRTTGPKMEPQNRPAAPKPSPKNTPPAPSY